MAQPMMSHIWGIATLPGILWSRAESLKWQLQLHWAEYKTATRRQFVAPAEKIATCSIQFQQELQSAIPPHLGNLVKSLLYSKTSSAEATQWGSPHKDEAKQWYLEYLRTAGHANASVKDSGLVINLEDPCLACSAVGSIVEIKCRYTAVKKGLDPASAAKIKNFFCKAVTRGNLSWNGTITVSTKFKQQWPSPKDLGAILLCGLQRGYP